MISAGSLLLAAMAMLLAVPSAVFAVEICAAVFLPHRIDRSQAMAARRARIAVLIPAHNEARGLLATLSDIRPQLHPSDRLLVVADNCTDETATIAASVAAEVVVRSDLTKIGKGYALDWGLNYLALNPPEIVIMIDADCRLAEDAIDRLASVCEQSQRPVQSLYLMVASEGSPINHQVAEFAWRVRNWVRPLGLMALSLPCQLMGSGMAFPWTVIRSVELSSAHIVEDLRLGLDLANSGCAPIFCPSAVVTSTFPSSAEGAKGQRRRWEHGQIGLVLTTAIPRLLQAAKEGNPNLLALVLDLVVPPLSLFLILLIVMLIVSGLALLLGLDAAAFTISLGCVVVVSLATMLAWVSRGREVLPLRSLMLVPSYFLAKFRQYVAAVLGERVSQWVRADRG